MQYSQKYNIVSFLEPIEVNAEFMMTDWPLHVTLADVFAADLDRDIEQKLADLFSKQSPISLSACDDAVLGTANVILIKNSNELQNLHNLIVDLLENSGATFNTPEFTRTGFLPHSTIQKSGRLHRGDNIELSTISLVDMFPGGNWQQRKVVSTFKLNKSRP